MLNQLLFIILFLTLLAPSLEARQTVRLSTGEWPPFISESLEKNGLLSQITAEAFALEGIDVQLGFFPWARATELSKSGEWDGTIAFVKLQEREKYYLFSDPLYVGKYVFFHLKSFPLKWTHFEDLGSIQIAATRGFGGMGDRFLEAEKNNIIHVQRLTSDVQSFNMLLTGRVQAVPSDLEVGYVLLQKLYPADLEKFTHHPKEIHRAAYCLVISKKNKNAPELIAKFNKGLQHLRKTGRYQEILKSWYSKSIYKNAVPPSALPALPH